MPKVECTIEDCKIETEDGRKVSGVVATCTRCGHATESFGTGENSIKRCLVLLREECPEGEENYYVEEE